MYGKGCLFVLNVALDFFQQNFRNILRFWTPLQQTNFENIVAIEKIAHDEQFLLLPQCFQLFCVIIHPIKSRFVVYGKGLIINTSLLNNHMRKSNPAPGTDTLTTATVSISMVSKSSIHFGMAFTMSCKVAAGSLAKACYNQKQETISMVGKSLIHFWRDFTMACKIAAGSLAKACYNQKQETISMVSQSSIHTGRAFTMACKVAAGSLARACYNQKQDIFQW